MTAVSAAVVALGAVGSALAGVRWLRVAQREHYLPTSVLRFAWRWWYGLALNRALAAVGLAGVAVMPVVPAVGVVPCLAAMAGPVGLHLRGRTSPLVWTRRLRTLGATWAVLQSGAIAAGAVLGAGRLVAPVAALATPALVDLACALTARVERRLARRFVESARARLARVKPSVVAITGSYGKTTTKGYVAHLVGPSRATVASPASWNNQAGLARTINERLALGTEVLVAEMGTYGPGEIAGLCAWLRPTLAVITAIGPVHLERFGSEDRIVEAKAEILAGAAVAVLNVDDHRLAALADRASAAGQRVVRCSGRDASADVAAIPGPGGLPDVAAIPGPGGESLEGNTQDAQQAARPPSRQAAAAHAAHLADATPATLGVRGMVVPVRIPPHAQPTNVACAVAAALELGVRMDQVAELLPTLPAAPNRLRSYRSEAGLTVIDDTYNSNPAGAQAALTALAALASSNGRQPSHSRRRVVVTPGMVELGARQETENTAFAAAASSVATDLVVVGHTNRRALRRGAIPPLRLTEVATRHQAVEWVRSNLHHGDVVLYENDLPDHYP